MKKLMFLFGVVAILFTTSCIKGPTSGGKSEGTFVGKLVVTDVDSGEVTYTIDDAEVVVTIPNILQPKFDILFKRVKFAEAMPVELNLELKDIPFIQTVSEDGKAINYVFEAKNIIPTGFEEYPIEKVWGSIGGVVDIQFDMERKSKYYHVGFKAGDTTSESAL